MVVACIAQCSVYRRAVRDGGYMHGSVFSVGRIVRDGGCLLVMHGSVFSVRRIVRGDRCLLVMHAWLSVQWNGSLIKPGTQLVATDFALSLSITIPQSQRL